MSTSLANHLTEETLILQYYGEADDAASVEQHLAACAHCRVEFERLRRVLALVDVQDVPEPAPGFERQVWARLAPELEMRRTQSWFAWLFPAHGPRWVYAGGVAALLLVAFVAGRFSRPEAPQAPAATVTTAAAAGNLS